MNETRSERPVGGHGRGLSTMGAAVVAAFAMGGNAYAFEFDTGNPDVQVRWDNTVRYNYAQRMKARDPMIGNSSLFDEGTYLFDKGDAVSNRLDLLTELDVVYKKSMGLRVSAAGWYDDAYGDKGKSNPALSSIASYPNNDFSPYVKRYYAGPSGEWLDAFVFVNFDLGNAPVKVKAGRHAVTWGEALFLGGALHSVQYSQVPLDLQKGFATPGVEAKELFRPLNQISGQAQVANSLSVAAQYFLDWESFRYPEGGTYLGPADFAFNGPDRVFAGGAFFNRGTAAEPKKRGEYGLSARWSPEVLDATVGFYYRNFADKMPQAFITNVTAGSRAYNLIYADDIDLYGISLGKNIAGVSVGAEVSYRRNTPLNSQTLGVAVGLPAQGDTKGPRGDTYHALVNVLGTISKTPVFDAATWAAELTWMRWDKVRSGANLFNAVGFAPCAATGEYAGCATKTYLGAAVAFTPTWYQVFPGVDLSMPMTYAVGLNGNAAVTFGGNEGLGNFSIGLGADIYQKYRVDLKYSGYFGRYRTGVVPITGTGVTAINGFTTALEDRNFVSLTLKTTF